MLSSVDCRKIVVLGNPGVGKTSIIQRYVHNQFKESYSATLGFNIYTRYTTIGEKKIGLSIWDVGGQEAFKKFAFRYLVEADAAIFVADVSHPNSINDLTLWNERLDQISNRKIPKIILFNKIDLDHNIDEISDRLNQTEIRKSFNGIVFASAKTGKNVTDIFSMIANMLTGWNESFGIPAKQQISFNGSLTDSQLPVVFFSSDKCTWCKPALDNIKSLSKEFPLTIRVINITANEELALEYGIQSLPTTIIGSKTIVGDLDSRIMRMIIADEYTRLVTR